MNGLIKQCARYAPVTVASSFGSSLRYPDGEGVFSCFQIAQIDIFGVVTVPGHQLERLKSEELRPFEKLPEQGLELRYVPQSSRRG